MSGSTTDACFIVAMTWHFNVSSCEIGYWGVLIPVLAANTVFLYNRLGTTGLTVNIKQLCGRLLKQYKAIK